MQHYETALAPVPPPQAGDGVIDASLAHFLERLVAAHQSKVEANEDGAGSFGPLHYVASLGKANLLEHLLSLGLDKDERDSEGQTPLMWVIAADGTEELMDTLVDNGASVNMQNYLGETPLFIAAKLGLTAKVNYLLEYGANVHTCNLDSASPLHAAAALGDTELVSLLVKYGAHVNAVDDEGDTPLHWAIREECGQVACLLVHYGADLRLANEDGETAIDLAMALNEVDLMQSLIHVHQNGLAAPSMEDDLALDVRQLRLQEQQTAFPQISLKTYTAESFSALVAPAATHVI